MSALRPIEIQLKTINLLYQSIALWLLNITYRTGERRYPRPWDPVTLHHSWPATAQCSPLQVCLWAGGPWPDSPRWSNAQLSPRAHTCHTTIQQQAFITVFIRCWPGRYIPQDLPPNPLRSCSQQLMGLTPQRNNDPHEASYTSFWYSARLQLPMFYDI